jgi:hypothetical protein
MVMVNDLWMEVGGAGRAEWIWVRGFWWRGDELRVSKGTEYWWTAGKGVRPDAG